MSNELEFAWDNANSFGDRNRPRDMRYIGTVTREFIKGVREFLFYIYANNQYWYESRTIKN